MLSRKEGNGRPRWSWRPRGAKLLVETAKHVQDECTVGDKLAKMNEVIGHTLQALAVIRDGQIAFDEHPKAGIEAPGTRLLVPRN